MTVTARPFAIKRAIVEGGFVTRNIHRLRSINFEESTWTHQFHKPYANDWGKARDKAREEIKLREIRKNYNDSNEVVNN